MKSSTTARPKAIYRANIQRFLESHPGGKGISLKTAAPREKMVLGKRWVKNDAPYIKIWEKIGKAMLISSVVISINNNVHADQFDDELTAIADQANLIKHGLPNPDETFLEQERLARMVRDYMLHFVPDETYLNLVYAAQLRMIIKSLYAPD